MKKILFVIFSFILSFNIFANNYIKEEFFIEKYSVERQVTETFNKNGDLIRSIKAKLPYTEDLEVHTKISYINDLHTISEAKSTNNKIVMKNETKYKKKPEFSDIEIQKLLEESLTNPLKNYQETQNKIAKAISNIEYQYTELSQVFNGTKITVISEVDANANIRTKIYMNDKIHSELFIKNGELYKRITYPEANKKIIIDYKDNFSFTTYTYENNILIMETHIDPNQKISKIISYHDDKVRKITAPVSFDKNNMEIVISGTMIMELYDKNGNLIESTEQTIDRPIREKIIDF